MYRGLQTLTAIKLGTSRPLVSLISRLDMWLPDLVKNGRQLQNYSFLGPFLGLSGYSEDNKKLAKNKDLDLEQLKHDIPLVLRESRDLIFKIIYNLLLPKDNRGEVLSYFAKVLNYNTKKSGIQVGVFIN